MKILLFGSTGQVGYELQKSLQPLGKLIVADRNIVNLENASDIINCISNHNPNIIVNAAAYTAVDKAESEPKKAYDINVSAVSVIAESAKKCDALLVHYSTDYIFDGKKKEAYNEVDIPNPLSAYGETKFLGEQAIQLSNCKHLIFRTSWVYSSRRNNFVKTILDLAKKQRVLRVVNDQIGSPTSAKMIADVTFMCLHNIFNNKLLIKNINGTYNLSANNEISWHGFAKYIVTLGHELGISLLTKEEDIMPINTSEIKLIAKRPFNSKLNNDKIQKTFKVYLPTWQILIKRFMKEIYL